MRGCVAGTVTTDGQPHPKADLRAGAVGALTVHYQ